MRTLANKSVLVTGGAGFIGSHLVDRILKELPKKVVVVDNFFLGDIENLKPAIAAGVEVIRDDIEFYTSVQYIVEMHDIDVVFNCATKALNYSFANPANAFMTNCTGVVNLLELLRHGSYETLVHFSTSEVYGSAVYEPMDELHPYRPLTAYAAGKAAADHALASYVEMFGVDAITVRPFNNYGPRQNWSGPLAGLIPRTLRRLHDNLSPQVFGTGSQTRDFIYVEDTVDAVLSYFKVADKGCVVNISSDGQQSVLDVIRGLQNLCGNSLPIVFQPPRQADVDCHIASNRVLKSMIEFSPRSFEQGLRETVDWYLQKWKE